MRRFAMAVVVAVVAVSAHGYVEMVSPKIETLAPQRVLEACDGLSTNGCTKVADARMLCECLPEKDGWKLHASVRAVPQIFITNIKWLAHEKGHVWDFKNYITAHVNALGKRRFETQEACGRYLLAASDAFPDTMKRVARLSAERRDGRRASSEDHLVVMKAEIMPKLMDDRLANLAKDIPAAAGHAQNRTAKNRDLVGKSGKHVEASFRQSYAAVDAKQLVAGRVFAKNVAVFVSRLFFDDDDHVVEQPRELVRQLFESLFHELLEFRSA
jgi:hypothetical protein